MRWVFKQLYAQVKRRILRLIDELYWIGCVGSKRSGVALIRLDAIGDFILWIDTAKEYREFYKSDNITLIANEEWVELALQLPYWDKIIPVSTSRLSESATYRWTTLRKIRRSGFAVAIQPTFSRVLSLGDSLIRASNAPQRIGSEGDLSNMTIQERSRANCWYTSLAPASKKPLHELHRNAEFINFVTRKHHTVKIPSLPESMENRVVNNLDIDYFVVAPGSSWNGKRWDPRNYAALIAGICTKYKLKPVICGTRSERELCEKIEKDSRQYCTNLAGLTSLVDYIEIIRRAKLIISNDSSAAHFAAAVGTPVVCILGGGHYGRFFPYPKDFSRLSMFVVNKKMDCYDCNWVCRHARKHGRPVHCIDSIEFEDVLRIADEALNFPKVSRILINSK
jgi:ADP-heptose:LPS heptosyltransferase